MSLLATRVLLVEDDPLVRRVFVRILRPVADVIDVASGEAALAAIGTVGGFAAIVSDVTLEGMSGEELFFDLQRQSPAMADRFIAVAGSDVAELDPAFRAALGDRLLTKPVSIHGLQRLVLSLVSSTPATPPAA